MEVDGKKRLHIAMFPWLAYGHIMPFLQISKFLAQKGHQIYFISTPKNITSLPKLPSDLQSNISFIQLPLPHVNGLPPGVESTCQLPTHLIPFLKKAYEKLQPQLAEFLQKSSQVKWIFHDFNAYWLEPMATELGINLVYFCIISGSGSAFFGPPSERLSRKQPEDFTVVPAWMDYPNNIAFKLHEIVSHPEIKDAVCAVEGRGKTISNCKIVALRSCFEVEADALRVLNKSYQKPVIPVGLLPPSLPTDDDKEYESWEVLKKWLDSKQEKSVFYVALGSEASLSQESMHELAFGIEKSRLPFVWVVRSRPLVEGSVQDTIPPGFEERVSNRGLLLRGWAPQLRILAHPSVGGFLTHCGWSSVIEALGFGLPLILFPSGSADVGLIARLMHDKKVGLEIERNNLDGSFTSELVADTINQVMVDPKHEQLRMHAYEMKEIFSNVDLSNKYLDEFTRFIEEFPPSNSIFVSE